MVASIPEQQQDNSSIEFTSVVSKPNNPSSSATTKPHNNSNSCEDTESPSDSDYSFGTVGYNTDGDEEAGVPCRGILRIRTQAESEAVRFDESKSPKKTTLSEEVEEAGGESLERPDETAATEEEGSSDDKAQDRTVQFSDVEVREYPYCLGDNPSTNVGVPLTIDWEPQSSGRLSVDDYEASRPDRRCSEQLRIPSFLREELLRNSGYSRAAIQKGLRNVNIARGQRRRTNETKQLQTIQEWAEKLYRGAKNATVRRNQKQKEREHLQQLKSQDSEGLQQLRSQQQQQQQQQQRRGTWHGTTPHQNQQREEQQEGQSLLSSSSDVGHASAPNLLAGMSSSSLEEEE